MSKIKYFKNFILCGDLSYRCLLCKENFVNVAALDRHLRWENHRKSLKALNCMAQFGKNYIYKLDPYYYCSFCNNTMTDIPEIKQHIDSDKHKNHKTNPAAATTRVEVKLVDEAILIKNYPITHFQWHGIIDMRCVLCNVAVNNMSAHVQLPPHVVRLLQAHISDVDDKYYRKIDKNTFQCFTCKKTFSMNLFDDHFANHSNNNCLGDIKPTNEEPKKTPTVYHKVGKELKGCTMDDGNESHPTVVCGTGMERIRTTEWDIEMLAGLEDDFLSIDTVARKVTCKTCKIDIRVSRGDIASHLYSHGLYTSNYSPVMKKIIGHVETNYVLRNIDHGAVRSKLAKYGKENYIKLNPGGSKGYCTLCDKMLSPNMDVFEKHTAGCYHKGHLELKGIEKSRPHERGSYRPVYTMELIDSLLYSADKKVFLINDTLLMDEDSFFLLKRIEHGKYYKKTKCFACDETMSPEDEKEHCISWKHKSKLLAAKSITEDRLSMREVRPRLYHCGVCNETLPYWEALKKHCKKMNHDINFRQSLGVFLKKFGFSKTIALKTNKDNLYMQLLNAVFHTKYVIKLES